MSNPYKTTPLEIFKKHGISEEYMNNVHDRILEQLNNLNTEVIAAVLMTVVNRIVNSFDDKKDYLFFVELIFINIERELEKLKDFGHYPFWDEK